MQQLPQRKRRPRLPSQEYKAIRRYYVTINTFHRRLYFCDPKVVEALVRYLRKESQKSHFKVWIYCFMPDHLHILLEGTAEESDLESFIKIFKQKTSFYFKKKYREHLWHPSYYDRVLRKDEALREVIKYIANNPVRAGLVEEWTDYPFTYSFVCELKDLM